MTTCRVVIVISVFYALFVDAEGLCDDITVSRFYIERRKHSAIKIWRFQTTIDLPSSSKTRYKCSGKRIANRIVRNITNHRLHTQISSGHFASGKLHQINASGTPLYTRETSYGFSLPSIAHSCVHQRENHL